MLRFKIDLKYRLVCSSRLGAQEIMALTYVDNDFAAHTSIGGGTVNVGTMMLVCSAW